MNHNDSGSAAQLPPNLALQSIEAHPLEFTGSGGEYFRVWIVNVLLGILTLGFYTPWARRRTAQYFYDHSMVAGSPLEFTAQQRKMVMGFVMLVLLTVAYNIAAESGQDTAVALFLLAGAVLAVMAFSFARCRGKSAPRRGRCATSGSVPHPACFGLTPRSLAAWTRAAASFWRCCRAWVSANFRP